MHSIDAFVRGLRKRGVGETFGKSFIKKYQKRCDCPLRERAGDAQKQMHK